MSEWFFAIILGVIEGITEFLPISSTGHLILAGSLLGWQGEFSKIFNVVIQIGAVLAVCWHFRKKISRIILGLPNDSFSIKFSVNVIIACIPAVILGLLYSKHIKSILYAPIPVACALIGGGIIILLVERIKVKNSEHVISSKTSDDKAHDIARVNHLEQLTIKDALKVGFAQCFALIPGMSRSGSTIIGGLLFGLNRRVATEFSFFLAIPIMFGAAAHDLMEAKDMLNEENLSILLLGTIAAFISAMFCIRWLLRYISSHDFTVFAWYRIIFGMIIIITNYAGLINWV